MSRLGEGRRSTNGEAMTTKRKSPRPHVRMSRNAIRVHRLVNKGAYAAMVRGKHEYLEDRLAAILAAKRRKLAALEREKGTTTNDQP
jgi:hypothetical protein